ncbi:restriction endonuclease subunit S [Aeromonas veronii bv. sobria]|uniref:restriction endonuclease subunit S n=1 Tax=Aeromonas TaxID=642 RepID=UPI0035C17156
MVPNGWSQKTLEDLSIVERGKFSARPRNDPRYFGGEMPFVQTGDVTGSKTYLNSFTQTLNQDGIGVSKVFPKGSILITIAANIGDTAITSFDVACPDSVVAIQPYSTKADTYWLKNVLDTKKEDLDSQSTQNAQKNINLQVLKPLVILTPPLSEQKKIAKILSTWDKAINTTEQLLANSQQQKKALMQQLLTGKKRLLDKNGVRFSGEWKAQRIGSLLKEVKRPVQWDDDSEYHLLSVKRRSEGVVLREILKGSDILTKKMNTALAGDFLISKMQVVHGATGLVTEEFNKCHISDSYIALRPKDDEKIDIAFFSWFSKQKIMYHKAFLCSYGVHIEKMTFNFNMFVKERVVIPVTLEEQQKIATILSIADQEISALQQKLAALKQEKQALMQQLLTGKRRVKVEEAA